MPRRRDTTLADARAKQKQLDKIADRFEDFRPASEALTMVRAVPTIFPQVDHASRVGGWPIERSTLVHGPSNEGKTLFILGLILSFLRLGHLVLFIDAERTTPRDWVEKLLGEYLTSRLFKLEKPEGNSYETVRAMVRRFLTRLIDMKRAREIPADMAAIIVCDSMKKLLPDGLFEEVLADARAKAITDKSGKSTDRAGQLQAKLNSAWLKELVPLLDHAGATFVPIAREMEDPNADEWKKKFGQAYKIGGGGDLIYDSSFGVRIERAGYVTDGSKEKKRVLGERHRATIWKTKVGGKDGKFSVAHFHSSNGLLVPFGFDRARDVLDLAARLGVVTASAGRYAHEDQIVGHGENQAVVRLTEAPEWLARIEGECRALFSGKAPPSHDEDGVVTEG